MRRLMKQKISLFSHPIPLRIIGMNTINVEENTNFRTYLGLPISHKRPTRAKVQFVVDKVRSSLASWKTRILSRAGRLCLISSTLYTIPAYYMLATMLPKSTLKDLNSICNNFLWVEEGGRKKLNLINKHTTFLPKDRGGLSIYPKPNPYEPCLRGQACVEDRPRPS